MNILPHKSWHVRTKKNIARVRKDEAAAAENEKEKQRRIQLAAQESRTSFPRDRASKRIEESGEGLPIPLSQVADVTQSDGHINFFQDLEDGKKLDSEVNKEYEKEKKKEQEDYEKKIGYLVHLGQNSIEQTKERPWYETSTVARHSVIQNKPPTVPISSETTQVKLAQLKEFEDPLKDIRKYLSTSSVKKALETEKSRKSQLDSPLPSSSTLHDDRKIKHIHRRKRQAKSKKGKKKRSRRESHTSESSSDSESEEHQKKRQLEQLRSERLEREREERRKSEKLLATLRGEVPIGEQPAPLTLSRSVTTGRPPAPTMMKQKYNSQFNPQLARQNFDD